MSNSDASVVQNDLHIVEKYPPTPPGALHLWTAVVDVDAPVDLGQSAMGRRYMVPILGGRFYPGDAGHGLSGIVLPGGADRQLMRSDGVKELDAIYEMKTNADIALSIRNRVIVDQTRTPERYAMSVLEVTAPDGPLGWLSRRLIVGTLQSARPDLPCVIVRAWMLETQPMA